MSDDEQDIQVSGEPTERLTRLCAEMTKVLDLPENDDVQAVVFLADKKRGGIQTHGYDDQSEALAALLYHMQVMFRSMGKELQLMTEDGVFRL